MFVFGDHLVQALAFCEPIFGKIDNNHDNNIRILMTVQLIFHQTALQATDGA